MHRLRACMQYIFEHLLLYRVCVFLHMCVGSSMTKNNTNTKRKSPFGLVVDVLLTLYLYSEGANSC